MAGIFSPNLQSQVTPESPTEMASPIASLAQLGSTIVQGLGGARDRAEREAKANAPSYTQLKDEREAGQLSDYSTELQRLEGLKGQVSAQAYNLELRKVNMNYLDRLSDPGFVAARETITGIPDERIGRTDSEILINELSLTAQGQAEISFAAQQLKAQDQEATTDSVAAVIRQREVTKLSVDNMQIQDEASFRQVKPAINELINMFTQDTQNSVFTLKEAGVPVTGAMVQDRYVDFLQLQTQITSSIPANIPEAQKEDVLKSLGRTEDFFLQLGMSKENGEIKLLNTDELQVQAKISTYVSVLNQSENATDNMLALKIMDKDYKLDPATYGLLETRIAALGTETDVMPDWITEADIVVTNDLIGTYENLVTFQQSGGMARFTQDQKMTNGALSLVNPEEQAKWSGMTNAQGWTATKAFGTASKGFSKDSILSGNMTDGFYNSMAGLALSFESINIEEEPISFNGLRKEVSSKLPDLIKTAEAVDPAKGAAIKSLMFRSLTTQKFQYDTRLASDESTLGVTFNPSTRTYNLTSNTSDPAKLTIAAIVNNRYNGNLVAATEDGFSRTTSEDLALLPNPSATQTDINRAVYTLRGLAPQVDEVKDLLDLRSSAVYLSNLASQIEPQSSKDAREAAAELATQEQSNQVQSTTASLVANGPVSVNLGIDFGQIEDDAGLPTGFLERTAQIESSGDPSAKNPTSSAGGLFQQIDENAREYGVTNRFDPMQSTKGAVKFAQDNQRKLRSVLNREPTAAELYLAHQQGGGGASALLGNANENVVSVLTRVYKGNAERARDAVRLNGGQESMTAGEFANIWINKFNKGVRSPNLSPEVTTSELPPETTEGTTSTPASAPVVGGQGVAPVEGVQATADLPEEAEEEAPAARPAANRPTTPPDITALLQAIGSRSLSEEEVNQLDQYIAGLGG